MSESEEPLLLKTQIFSGVSGAASSKQFIVIKKNPFNGKVFLIGFLSIVFFIHWFFPGEDLAQKRLYISIVVFLIVLVIITNAIYTIVEEQLLLIVPINLQMTSIYLLGQKKVVSVPWSKIGEFMIIDEVVGQQVLPFLAVEVKNNENGCLVILFSNTRPRLYFLERIYKELQTLVDANR